MKQNKQTQFREPAIYVVPADIRKKVTKLKLYLTNPYVNICKYWGYNKSSKLLRVIFIQEHNNDYIYTNVTKDDWDNLQTVNAGKYFYHNIVCNKEHKCYSLRDYNIRQLKVQNFVICKKSKINNDNMDTEYNTIYLPGTKIYHKKYGYGEVLDYNVNNDNIRYTLKFGKINKIINPNSCWGPISNKGKRKIVEE